MSRLRRCLFGSAASLMFVCAGCFAPTGSVTVSSSDTSDASTTGPGVTTTTSDASTSASDTDPGMTGMTGSTGSTGATTIDPTTTDPTLTGTTGSTTGTDLPECGDGEIDLGEECDDGPGNGDSNKCTSECEAARCGDGLRCSACDPVEECDAANESCSDQCLLAGKLIFATATLHRGDVGFMAADQICQDVGDTYFSKPRNFIAWLSGSQAISSRLDMNTLPYRLPDGQIVAASTKSLLNGEIMHPVDQDPMGGTITAGIGCDPADLAWTGSLPGGSPGPVHCSDWSSQGGMGLAGALKGVDGLWTDFCTLNCSESLRLYCLETSL